MIFVYHENAKLPKLAWCAVMTQNSRIIDVYHGKGVETFENSFFEGAWSGNLYDFDFDQSGFFMGSGGKIIKGKGRVQVLFSTPSHALERLYSIEKTDSLYISNSLPFILFMTSSELDNDYMDYERDFNSILKGIYRYKKQIPLSGNMVVNLHYYCNILVDGSLRIKEEVKQFSIDFTCYDEYYNSLMQAIGSLVENAQSLERKMKYGLVTTISKGYDSAAAAALAKCHGCNTAVSFNRPERYADDSGEEIASKLGYKNIVLKSADEYLSNNSLVEAEFLASGELGSDIVFSAFEREFENNIVFNGNLGDTFWDKSRDDANIEMRFEDGVFSETCYIEYRLRVGYITLLPASFGAIKWPLIYKISNSEDMKKYSVGGSYDRPIPRRILESNGIDRSMFGQSKKGAGINYRYDTLRRIRKRMSPQSFNSFYEFYKSHRRKGYRIIKRWILYFWQTRGVYINHLLNKLGIKTGKNKVQCDELSNPGAPSYLFNWGVHEMIKKYQNAFANSDT